MTTDIVLRCAMQRDAEALSTFAARLFRETYAADTAASDLADYIAGNFGSERQRAEIVDPRGVVLLAGCDKSFATCKAKFANALNFRGFPHLPGNDTAYSYVADGGNFDGGPVVP